MNYAETILPEFDREMANTPGAMLSRPLGRVVSPEVLRRACPTSRCKWIHRPPGMRDPVAEASLAFAAAHGRGSSIRFGRAAKAWHAALFATSRFLLDK
jgi:hypothetical protein